MIFEGTIRKFGDFVDTDVIIPARYLTSRDRAFLGRHCMEAIEPTFAQRATPGDVLIAGREFGCGSSREHAVLALQGVGISCLVATSYARIFFRNAINLGLPIVVCPAAAEAAREGGIARVDLALGAIEIEGATYVAEPFPEFLQSLIALGGVVPFVRARLEGGDAALSAATDAGGSKTNQE